VQQKQHAGTNELLEIVISNDFPPPNHYNFLPNVEIVTPCKKIQNHRFDVGFVLDSGTDRVGKVLPVLQKCKHIINIDHHQSRAKGIENISWVDPTVCSVAEMIYDFFEHSAWNVSLNSDIAACLYTGIIYDTGSFRYPRTIPRTHRIAAKLLETGIGFTKISEQLFLEKPFSAVQLLGAVLQNLHRDPSGEIIWGTITQALLKRIRARPEEDEGIITQYAFTEGTKVAALFKEISATEVKVSFRTRGAIDVGRFAKKMSPQGGGHQRAAGCTLKGTIEEVQTLVISMLQKELQENS
jgi:phosphoesterase RecJ-like protein